MDTLYWVALYEDNKAIPEYSPDTGKRNKWDDIPKENMIGMMWMPFTDKLLKKITHKMPDKRIALPFLPKYKLELPEGAKVLKPYRTQEIIIKRRYKCLQCGELFKPSEAEVFVRKNKQEVPVCPKCKASDVFICEHCGYRTKDTEGRTKCPACNKDLFWNYQTVIVPENMEERHTYYHLGYELNNRKYEIIIDEFGNVEMK